MSGIYGQRLTRLREVMNRKNTDAVLITKRENCMYMSGFTGTTACLFISGKRAALLTDFRYAEQAAAQACEYEIVRYMGTYSNELNDLIKSEKVERLSFEDGHLAFAGYAELSSKLEVREFSPLGAAVEELRGIKDASEIELIKKAARIADDAYAHILGFIKPGVTELELAAELEYFMKRQGASGPSFETIIASGARASMPHGVASEKRIEAGDVITMDYGAIYKGYCSDITRTVFLGKPATELEEIYHIVLEAQLKGIEAVKQGITGKEADAAAREYITGAGYGDYFGHGMGHGVGLEIHEQPTLSVRGTVELRNGMVVTVEPGIYIKGLGGVRIEDMAVVNGERADVLTSAPKTMTVL